MTIKAIETEHRGYIFRSRVEARWAVLLDTLNVEWRYEDEGYEMETGERYLPDFWLPQHDLWLEIKGGGITPTDANKVKALRAESGKEVVIAQGLPEPYAPPKAHYDWRGKVAPTAVSSYLQSVLLEKLMLGNPRNSGRWPDGGVEIACPFCNDTYVHIKDTRYVSGNDNYKAWNGRGDAIYIDMYCESSCWWTLRFGFHKGNTFAAIENAHTPMYDFVMWLANSNTELYEAALNAARAARFEHGEKPMGVRR